MISEQYFWYRMTSLRSIAILSSFSYLVKSDSSLCAPVAHCDGVFATEAYFPVDVTDPMKHVNRGIFNDNCDSSLTIALLHELRISRCLIK